MLFVLILIADCAYGQKTACCAIALNYSCYQVRACVFLDQSIDFARSAHRTVREVCGKTQNTIRIHLSWKMDMRAAEAARIKRNVKILEGNLFNMAAVKRFINRIPGIKMLFKSRHSWPAGGKRFCMAVVLCLFIFIALDKRLTVRTYRETTSFVQEPVRLAVITDLHAGMYGEGQKDLLDAVSRQEPDVVLLAGDIADDEVPDDGVWMLLSQLSGKYLCFYVSGNHEFWSGRAEEVKRKMRTYGVEVLEGEGRLLEVRGQKLQIFGVDDPDRFGKGARLTDGTSEEWQAQLVCCEEQRKEGVYSILLSHRPELVQDYEDSGFDLVISGHAHGGQIRIPWIVNGLYAPNQGWFPEYAGGRYALGAHTAMIVSRGLCRNELPRVFNRPELVVVDIVPA